MARLFAGEKKNKLVALWRLLRGHDNGLREKEAADMMARPLVVALQRVKDVPSWDGNGARQTTICAAWRDAAMSIRKDACGTQKNKPINMTKLVALIFQLAGIIEVGDNDAESQW